MTCWQRLRDWQQTEVWDRLQRVLLNRLGRRKAIDFCQAALDSASFAADRVRSHRPEPNRRGKLGTKGHFLVSADLSTPGCGGRAAPGAHRNCQPGLDGTGCPRSARPVTVRLALTEAPAR